MGTKQPTQDSSNSDKLQESLEFSNVQYFTVDIIDGLWNNQEGWFYFDEAQQPWGPFATKEIAQAEEYLYGKWLDASSVTGPNYDDWRKTQKNPSIHNVD